MSWRVVIFTLLLAVGAAAFGGVQLGDWLVAHAPIAAAPPNSIDKDPDAVVLDADGKPYLAQPPQPLVNGVLGVPDVPMPVRWNTPKASLLIVNTNPDVWVSANKLSEAELLYLTEAGAKRIDGNPDVVSVDPPLPGQGSSAPLPVAAAVSLSDAKARSGHWQDVLRSELAQCAKLGFFDRPSCAWRARNRYCAPNQAWGAIPECPRRTD